MPAAAAAEPSNSFRADIAQLEAQLAAAIEERTKLQREIATMRRDTESTWAAERVENALLRERINDVAAEVARLTAALEGPARRSSRCSPWRLAVAKRPARRPAANRGEPRPTLRSTPRSRARSTLADRIRALQSTASRAASNRSAVNDASLDTPKSRP